MTDERPRTISRRALLRGAGAAGAAAAASAVGVSAKPGTTPARAAVPSSAVTQPAGTITTRVVYEQLSADEAELLGAIADHLIPDDEHGPGAVAAGAVVYID